MANTLEQKALEEMRAQGKTGIPKLLPHEGDIVRSWGRLSEVVEESYEGEDLTLDQRLKLDHISALLTLAATITENATDLQRAVTNRTQTDKQEQELLQNAMDLTAGFHSHDRVEEFYSIEHNPPINTDNLLIDLAKVLGRWQPEPEEDDELFRAQVSKAIVDQAIENGINGLGVVDPAAVLAQAIRVVREKNRELGLKTLDDEENE